MVDRSRAHAGRLATVSAGRRLEREREPGLAWLVELEYQLADGLVDLVAVRPLRSEVEFQPPVSSEVAGWYGVAAWLPGARLEFLERVAEAVVPSARVDEPCRVI